MCHLYPYNNVKLLRKLFYINICGFIGRGNFYMRPEYLTIAISNLNFNFPPLIVHITAGGPKVPIEGFVTLDAPSKNNIFVLNASTLPYLIVILVSTF